MEEDNSPNGIEALMNMYTSYSFIFFFIFIAVVGSELDYTHVYALLIINVHG